MYTYCDERPTFQWNMTTVLETWNPGHSWHSILYYICFCHLISHAKFVQMSEIRFFLPWPLREDTNKKECFFLVVGPLRCKPPWPLSKKNIFFSLNSRCFSPKIVRKKNSKLVSGFNKTKKKEEKKKWHGPLSH